MVGSSLVGFLEAIILGLIQGLTEFLPISSSAHLRIVGEFLPAAADPGATFTAITQLGTEAAVVIYFRHRIAGVIRAWFRSLRPGWVEAARRDPQVRLGWLVILGTIPIVLAGFFLQDVIRSAFRSLWIVAVVLIVFGLLLGLADWLGRRARDIDRLSYPHGLLVGLAQMLALVPGVSRSGASTSAALALGYTRTAAAEFAFLLAVPAVFGSGLYELLTAFREPGSSPFGWGETAVATGIAFLVGLAVIAGLMRYLQTKSFLPFVVYRVLLGGALIVLLSTGALQPE